MLFSPLQFVFPNNPIFLFVCWVLTLSVSQINLLTNFSSVKKKAHQWSSQRKLSPSPSLSCSDAFQSTLYSILIRTFFWQTFFWYFNQAVIFFCDFFLIYFISQVSHQWSSQHKLSPSPSLSCECFSVHSVFSPLLFSFEYPPASSTYNASLAFNISALFSSQPHSVQSLPDLHFCQLSYLC